MPTYAFFNFIFEPLEVVEHFAHLFHRVELGMPGEVTDERDIISATTECCRFELIPTHLNVLHPGPLCSYSSLSGMDVGIVFRRTKRQRRITESDVDWMDRMDGSIG